ncbi:hypothetical protein EVAR_9302_1 [Eumeta japonica]|uniref:Uncharacterized protein n=1 Tax=Eumeta variegata TaxID=151549 RepID=A0A4C1TMY5_EUMVA|nr:hypothetical protein EVAR_9302_1 [Eumeta japonica]
MCDKMAGKSLPRKCYANQFGGILRKGQILDSSLHNICDDDKDDDLENINETGTSTCLICTEFERNNEIWYRCTVCELWAHADCPGWDSTEGYVCDNC